MFKVGDKVKKRGGMNFGDGRKVATVIAVPDRVGYNDWAHSPEKTWIDGYDGAWIHTVELELAISVPFKEEDWL